MRAIRCGIPPHHISLSSQEFPTNFAELFSLGIEFNACSLHQLEEFGKLFPGKSCGIRLNPGSGSGANFKTDVGGPTASFGIWHEHVEKIKVSEVNFYLQFSFNNSNNKETWSKSEKEQIS